MLLGVHDLTPLHNGIQTSPVKLQLPCGGKQTAMRHFHIHRYTHKRTIFPQGLRLCERFVRFHRAHSFLSKPTTHSQRRRQHQTPQAQQRTNMNVRKGALTLLARLSRPARNKRQALSTTTIHTHTRTYFLSGVSSGLVPLTLFVQQFTTGEKPESRRRRARLGTGSHPKTLSDAIEEKGKHKHTEARTARLRGPMIATQTVLAVGTISIAIQPAVTGWVRLAYRKQQGRAKDANESKQKSEYKCMGGRRSI